MSLAAKPWGGRGRLCVVLSAPKLDRRSAWAYAFDVLVCMPRGTSACVSVSGVHPKCACRRVGFHRHCCSGGMLLWKQAISQFVVMPLQCIKAVNHTLTEGKALNALTCECGHSLADVWGCACATGSCT